MACNVEVKDIENRVKNQLLDAIPKMKFTRKDGLFSSTIKNTIENVASINSINKEYANNLFGNVIHASSANDLSRGQAAANKIYLEFLKDNVISNRDRVELDRQLAIIGNKAEGRPWKIQRGKVTKNLYIADPDLKPVHIKSYKKGFLATEFNESETPALYRKDPTLQERLFKGETWARAETILETIANSNHPLAKLASELKKYARNNNVQLNLDPVTVFSGKDYNFADEDLLANGFYDPEKNEIHIAKDGNFKKGEAEAVLLHEILHAFSYKALRQSEISEEFEKLYNYAKKNSKIAENYGFTDLDEFLVAIFTNSALMHDLAAIPAQSNKFKNLLEEIYAGLLKILNIKDKGLYKEAFALGSQVLSANDQIRKNASGIQRASEQYEFIPEDPELDLYLNASPLLASAMTEQNAQDELAQFASRRQVEHTTPKRPLSDNYVEYRAFKQKQLQITEAQIRALSKKRSAGLKGKDLIELTKQWTEANNKKRIIENQIEALKKDEVNLLFGSLLADLAAMDKALDDIASADSGAIESKIKFYHELIKGRHYTDDTVSTGIESLANFEHKDFSKVIDALEALEAKYSKNIETFGLKIINENLEFKQHVLENEDLTDEDRADLFAPSMDINWFERNFLGVTSAMNNDSILPQVYMSELKHTYNREHSVARNMVENLKIILNKIEATNKDFSFDFIFSVNQKGQKNGFIIDAFSDTWYKALNSLAFKLKTFNTQTIEKNYYALTKFYSQQAEIVDMRKLAFFKDLYGESYSEYFTFSEQEMAAYEAELKRKLGPKFEEIIQNLEAQLQNFESVKDSILHSNETSKSEQIAKRDIWAFTKSMNSKEDVRKKMHFEAPDGTVRQTFFRAFNSLTVIPKETRSVFNAAGFFEEIPSNFYDPNFEDIKTDPLKLEYWQQIREMAEYINDTYEANYHGRMSYPKVLKTLQQELIEDFTSKTLKGIPKVLRNLAHAYKEFSFDLGKYKEKGDVVANYSDRTDFETKSLAETFIQQGMKPTEAKTKAKEQVLNKYSTNINRDIESVLFLAALHRTRVAMEPTANILLGYFKTIGNKNKAGELKTRKRAIARMQEHIERVVLNQSEKYRGTGAFLGRSERSKKLSNFIGKIPIISKFLGGEKALFLLSKAEKEIFLEIEKLRKEGYSPKADFTIELSGVKYMQDRGKQYRIDPVPGAQDKAVRIPLEEFNSAFEEHLAKKAADLGLDLNLAGIIQGFLKILVIKSLALNPISGFFNRFEGKNAGAIMDMTGYYWPEGNLRKANNFMSFANMLKFLPSRISPQNKGKIHELKKLRAFGQMLNTLQDRKSVLERSVEESNFKLEARLNPFAFAVENPEFKNQMSIAVSILMDTYIMDIAGNKVPIFDGEKGEFLAHDLIEGRLILKPNFNTPENISNWQDFSGEAVARLQLRITNAVSKSQGNYDPLDIIGITKGILGRSAFLFMKWLPEHIMQRFSSGEGFDLFAGKKKLEGRIASTARTSKGALAGYYIGTMAVLWGISIPAAAVGGGLLSLFAIKKFLAKDTNPTAIKQEANHILDFVRFYQSVLASTLNFAPDLLNLPRGKDSRLRFNPKAFENVENLTEIEANNIHATAKELSIMIAVLMAKTALAYACWDDDDEADSYRRMFYNFVHNQGNRIIRSLGVYADPSVFLQDNMRMAMYEQTVNAAAFLQMTIQMITRFEIPEKYGKTASELFLPIPRMLTRGGKYPIIDEDWRPPGQDESVYSSWQMNIIGERNALEYSNAAIKDYTSHGEYSAKQEYAKLRKELKEDLVDYLKDNFKNLSKEQIEKQASKLMNQKYPIRAENQPYKDALEKLKLRQKALE